MKLDRLYVYEEKENDGTKKDIINKKKSCGYERVEPFRYDRTYALLNNYILHDDEVSDSVIYKRCATDKRVVKNSIRIWKNLNIRLHKVLFINKASEIRLVHPSDLPVKLIASDEYTLSSSKLNFYEYYSSNDEECETVKVDSPLKFDENGIVMETIELPIIGNRITSCCYNHEIAHTQLLSLKGSCLDILNSETLPLLIDEIFAFIIDKSGTSLKILRNDSLISYAQNIYSVFTNMDASFKDRVEWDTYNKSTLQAIYLSNIYQNGDDRVKSEMCMYIDKIFSGERTVEDMLDFYDAHVENVPKDLQFLKKTL